MIKKWSIIVYAFVFGYCSAMLIAIGTFSTQEQIDCDSGRLRKTYSVLWIKLRTELILDTSFARQALPNNSDSLSGIPKWKTVSKYFGNSNRSYAHEGGRIKSAINRMDMLIQRLEFKKASEVKHAILLQLQRDDVSELENLVSSVEKEIAFHNY